MDLLQALDSFNTIKKVPKKVAPKPAPKIQQGETKDTAVKLDLPPPPPQAPEKKEQPSKQKQKKKGPSSLKRPLETTQDVVVVVDSCERVKPSVENNNVLEKKEVKRLKLDAIDVKPSEPQQQQEISFDSSISVSTSSLAQLPSTKPKKNKRAQAIQDLFPKTTLISMFEGISPTQRENVLQLMIKSIDIYRSNVNSSFHMDHQYCLSYMKRLEERIYRAIFARPMRDLYNMYVNFVPFRALKRAC